MPPPYPPGSQRKQRAGETVTYAYDNLNQLTGVTTSDNSFTASYSYDDGGNIVSKTVNGVTTPYSYEDSNWKDKLTGYNRFAINYDEIGNPTGSHNGRFAWTGRQITAAETRSGTSIGYSYNADGIRIQKDIHGVVTNYFVDGSTILAEKTGNNVIWYIYDSDGEILGFTYNDTPYYYLKNQQGDVYKVVDASGTIVASYTYDPWGKVLSATGTMADTIGFFNPLRYRGYVYDTETGLYYLQSRYYNPELGRFINADEYIDSRSSTGYNLFSYCWNNPVNLSDYTGKYAATLVLSSSLTYSLSNALAGMMGGITASVSGIKAAIASSWLIPVCVAATAIAVVGIVSVVNRVRSLSYSATRVISAVQTKVKAKGVSPNSLKGYTVYVIVRKGTTDVVYVGMTKNYSSRKSAHSRRFPSSKYTMMPIATGLSYSQARALEQSLITAYTLDTLKNMINSISPKRWGFFKSEFEQMNMLIQSWLDPE